MKKLSLKPISRLGDDEREEFLAEQKSIDDADKLLRELEVVLAKLPPDNDNEWYYIDGMRPSNDPSIDQAWLVKMINRHFGPEIYANYPAGSPWVTLVRRRPKPAYRSLLAD